MLRPARRSVAVVAGVAFWGWSVAVVAAVAQRSAARGDPRPRFWCAGRLPVSMREGGLSPGRRRELPVDVVVLDGWHLVLGIRARCAMRAPGRVAMANNPPIERIIRPRRRWRDLGRRPPAPSSTRSRRVRSNLPEFAPALGGPSAPCARTRRKCGPPARTRREPRPCMRNAPDVGAPLRANPAEVPDRRYSDPPDVRDRTLLEPASLSSTFGPAMPPRRAAPRRRAHRPVLDSRPWISTPCQRRPRPSAR